MKSNAKIKWKKVENKFMHNFRCWCAGPYVICRSQKAAMRRVLCVLNENGQIKTMPEHYVTHVCDSCFQFFEMLSHEVGRRASVAYGALAVISFSYE